MAAAALGDMKDEFLMSSIRERYEKEIELGMETNNTRLEFAWCMVRSPRVTDMRHGLNVIVGLIVETSRSSREFRKRCQYCLAIAYARLKDYPESFRVIRNLRQMDHQCPEWKELYEAIDEKRFKEAVTAKILVTTFVTLLSSAAPFVAMFLRRK